MMSCLLGSMRAAGGAVLALALVGCAYRGSAGPIEPSELRSAEGWVAVGDVPIVQLDNEAQSGAAALTMVLTYWKRQATTDEVKAACPDLTESGNMRAVDLQSYAEGKGLTSFLFSGAIEVLEHELRQGRPVIVGLVKSYLGRGLVAHYEVVVGYHPAKRIVVTLDPSNGWRQNSLDAFQAEWELGDRLTLVMIPKPE